MLLSLCGVRTKVKAPLDHLMTLLMAKTGQAERNTVVSLFSGCGGLDLGFHEAGFNCVYAVDNDPAANAVYRHNIGHFAYVRDVTTPEFHSEIRELGSADVVLGGFPCQGFSKAGPKKQSDQRNVLYLEMREAIAALQPKIFIAENVDGLSQNFGGSYLHSITRDFTRVGYKVEHRIVDAVAYGVPQHRRRVIFVGIRVDQPTFIWPTVTHTLPRRNGESNIGDSTSSLWDQPKSRPPLKKAMSIADAIADLPALGEMDDHLVTYNWPNKYSHIIKAIGPRQKLCNVRHASSSIYTWAIPKVFGKTTPDQRAILDVIGRHRRLRKYGNIPNGNPLPVDEIETLLGRKTNAADFTALVELGYLKKMGEKFDLKGAMFCSGLFKRPAADEPSPTVLTNFHNPRYFLHPSEHRPFTLRECARLQGFPDSFQFTAAGITLEDGYRLVGNAVPPPLSSSLARAVTQFLKQANTESLHAA